MKHTHTLTRHADIQNWVSTRRGLPAIARVRDRFGDVHARLCLKFNKPADISGLPTLDDGMSPCSWSAWLAELDRQQLALKILEAKRANGEDVPAFELVERRTLN